MNATIPVTELRDLLRQHETLRDVPEGQLDWLVAQSELLRFKDCDTLFRRGDPIDHMYIVLEGLLVLKQEQQGAYREVGRVEPVQITGALPYSRADKASGTGFIHGELRVLAFPRAAFPEMIRNHYDLVRALVHVMTTRVREFTRQQQMTEKMASLGKLSAGLAHELNNPSAAVVRASQSLREHLGTVPDKFKQVISIRLEPEQVDRVNDMLFDRMRQPPGRRSLVEKSAAEDELLDWLEDEGVARAEDLAEVFNDAGFTVEDLDLVLDQVSADYLSPVLEWLENVLTTERMVKDIEDASRRIQDLVCSVKAYSHMDRSADQLNADVRDGIDTTLTMLAHKLRQKNIRVVNEYADDVPKIPAFVGELNQVWTNLIDNAADAIEEGGELTIDVRPMYRGVQVCVIDNGPGIPKELQSQVFDPFYTTKPMGEGTGMGLDITRRIVERHGGSIHLKSRPGRTVFRIVLPGQKK